MQNDFLVSEYNETNNYAKVNFTIFITWVTFYITVNYVGMGWLVDKEIKAENMQFAPVYSIIGFFIANTFTSIIACRGTLKYLEQANKRINEILLAQSQEIVIDKTIVKPISPLPIEFYKTGIGLFIIGIRSLLVLWICLLIFAIYLHYLQIINPIPSQR